MQHKLIVLISTLDYINNKLNYPKKECYHIINQYFIEKKHLRFQKRVDNHFNNTPTKMLSKIHV
ncbi:hypothetical protein DB723_05145 (plasmid) [Borrelia maritima]|uniref:Uncharacterized protein n=1 Tax=Borrelia maritima TaxID=2761123 RepID=A0A5J6WDW7_9SPIR|nr:hypothetical protein DB723_05145 [Borrelia maritima]